MPFWRREKEKTPPPKSPEETIRSLVASFFDENPDEVELAWYSSQDMTPYEPPLQLIREYIESKGAKVEVNLETLRGYVLNELKSRLEKRGAAKY